MCALEQVVFHCSYASDFFSFVSIFFSRPFILGNGNMVRCYFINHKWDFSCSTTTAAAAAEKVYKMRFVSAFFSQYAEYLHIFYLCVWLVGLVTTVCGHVFVFSIFSFSRIPISQSPFFSMWTFHHHSISWKIAEVFQIQNLPRSLDFYSCRGFLSCFCMVILLVEWHTVCATLCSEVNYIKLNAVYVLATHPKLHQIHTHNIKHFSCFLIKMYLVQNKAICDHTTTFQNIIWFEAVASPIGSTVLFQLMLNAFFLFFSSFDLYK